LAPRGTRRGGKARLFRGEVAPGVEVYIVAVEGPHDPERIAEAGRKGLVAGFTSDPGPCRVAVAAIHVAEERATGEARVRSPGLHLRMAVEGLRQLRDLPEPPESFSVAYVASMERGEALRLCTEISEECSDVEEHVLNCSRSELEEAFKTVVKARVERL